MCPLSELKFFQLFQNAFHMETRKDERCPCSCRSKRGLQGGTQEKLKAHSLLLVLAVAAQGEPGKVANYNFRIPEEGTRKRAWSPVHPARLGVALLVISCLGVLLKL